jgi:hypothetical protein
LRFAPNQRKCSGEHDPAWKRSSTGKPEQPKPRGRFTGQRLKLLRPETYRQAAVELLPEPRQQVPYDHICRKLRMSEHTLKAIEKAESLSIAKRK